MRYPIKLDDTRVQLFHEGRARRIYVAELSYDQKKDRYVLTYDERYTQLKKAIALGPMFSLFKLQHYSKKGKMFPIFLDRIPDRQNPAYPDYCYSQGISVDEKNPIILLGSIGRRGPSTFIFEAVYKTEFTPADIAKFREAVDITQYDFSAAFDISQATLQRIEAGKSFDENSLKRIEMMLTFPEVARWQLRQTGGRVHRHVLTRLWAFFAKPSTRAKKT